MEMSSLAKAAVQICALKAQKQREACEGVSDLQDFQKIALKSKMAIQGRFKLYKF